MAVPIIYKGDDTDFRGVSNLAIRLSADIDLAGCKIEFTFLGSRRTFTALDGETTIPFVFTSAETATMPVGTHKAKVRVFDPEGRVRTIDDSIRIKVTDDLAEAYGWEDEQEISVSIHQVKIAAPSHDGVILGDADVLDCSVPISEFKERVAYLWEKVGGVVKNRASLEY